MSRRRRNTLQWLAVAAVLLVLVAGVIVPVALTRTLSPARVARAASEALDRPVRIGAVGLHFSPWPRLRLENVSVAPNLEIDVLDVAWSPVALMGLRLEPARLEVTGARVAIVRGPDGRFGLGQAPGSDDATSAVESLPRPLPEIELKASRIEFLDHAVAGEPVRTLVVVDLLELTYSLLGGELRLHAQLGLGPSGEQGTLRLDGKMLPRPGGRLVGTSLKLEAEALRFDPRVLLPYLPESWDVRHLDGRVEARLELVASQNDEFDIDLELELAAGVYAIGELELGGATRASMQISWRAGELEIREGRLQAERAELGGRQGLGLDVAFGYAAEELKIESLHLDSLAASIGARGDESWALNVTHTGTISLRSTPELRGLVFGLSSVEARDAELMLSGPRGAEVHLFIDSLDARNLAQGARTTLRVEARLGNGEQGHVWFEAETGSLSIHPNFDALPISLEIRGESVEASLLEGFLPVGWAMQSRDLQFDGELQMSGAFATGFAGDLDLRLRTGTLGLGPIELHAPARLSGHVLDEGADAQAELSLEINEGGALEVAGLRLGAPATASGLLLAGGNALAFRGVHLAADHAELRGFRVGAVEAELAFEDGTLSFEPFVFEAYGGAWTQHGKLSLGAVPAFEVEVGVRDLRIEELAAVALGRAVERPEEPILLNGNGRFSGHWTGESRWLDPIAGEGRLDLRGGFVPSSRLLQAVFLAILDRLPLLGNLADDASTVSRTPIERARIPFRIAEGRFHSDALTLITGDYRLNGKGSLSHDLEIAAEIELSLTRDGTSKLLAFGAVSNPLRDALRIPAIPVEVTGPLDAPRIRADVSRLPMTTLHELLGLPSRAGDALRGAVETVIDLPGNIPRHRPAEEEPAETPPATPTHP